VKPGRVTGIPAGAYYYDPCAHCLVELAAGAQLTPAAYARHSGRPAFEEAAFSLFLVLDRGAIAPLYGENSERYALLEAGAMGQLLEDTGPRLGLGLCAVGTVDASALTPLFRLESGHAPLYSYVGGLIDPVAEAGRVEESTREMDRIRDLSEGERRDLIAALRESP
jgi:SagB-type dehydrogenase family enzyme